MKKCTLCIDRIYNENMEEVDRVHACVSTCPAGARHYGDLGDPNSAVSKLVVERTGFDLMAEMGYKPTTNICHLVREETLPKNRTCRAKFPHCR